MKRNDVYEAVDTANLTPLSELSNFKIVSDDPDVRGWDVLASDNKKIGTVEELMVDSDARRVAYLAVRLTGSGMNKSGHVLIPVESVWLDRNQKVYLDSTGSSDLGSLTEYDMSSYNQAGNYDRSADRLGNEREARVTLSEEALAVNKRQVQGEQMVEADVRRERAEVHRTGDVNEVEAGKRRR